MPDDPTFNEQMVAKYKAALLAIPPGVRSTTFEGVTVSYDDLLKGLSEWESRVNDEAGRRPRVASIRMNHF